MTTPHSRPGGPPQAPPQEIEERLGRTLTSIHRLLPLLGDVRKAETVQGLLRTAAEQAEAARTAHSRWIEEIRPAAPGPETLALIAAALAVVLGRPHRVLGIQKASPSVTWVNAWAIEGRFQHYSSHKVR